MSTVTPVSICSAALLMLGDNPISSFDDGTDRARLSSNLWPMLRDYVLRRHPWNCATKRIVLNPDEDAPLFDFAYRYTLPGDCLRVLQVGRLGARPRYRIESGGLLCDMSSLPLRYIWRSEVPATWDALLVNGMTAVMRAAFSYGITASGTMMQAIEPTLREILREARAVDGQEDDADALDDAPLLDARYSGIGRGGY